MPQSTKSKLARVYDRLLCLPDTRPIHLNRLLLVNTVVLSALVIGITAHTYFWISVRGEIRDIATGICCVPYLLFLTALQCAGIYKESPKLMTIVGLVFLGKSVFLFVSTVIEIIKMGPTMSFSKCGDIIGIMIFITAYLAFCAALDLRWARILRLPYPEGICLHCGYNLTGNTSGRCPECGVSWR